MKALFAVLAVVCILFIGIIDYCVIAIDQKHKKSEEIY